LIASGIHALQVADAKAGEDTVGGATRDWHSHAPPL